MNQQTGREEVYNQEKVFFQKKTGLKGEIPQNYEELLTEVSRWDRIGMPKVKEDDSKSSHTETVVKDMNLQKSGFVREPDFAFLYPDIDLDIDRLIHEGHLIEFRKAEQLHKDISVDMEKISVKAQKKLDQEVLSSTYN